MTRYLIVIGIGTLFATSGAPAQTTAGDAARGEQLLRDRGCMVCHGRGGVPDVVTPIARSYKPTYVAGVLWNHALAGRAGLTETALSASQASDLFAYFASRRFFETPGDAGRGKRVFAEKHCLECHGGPQRLSAEVRSVQEWDSLRDPIAFAEEMWNHSPNMLRSCADERVRYPHFTSQELNDLTVYLENLPIARNRELGFRVGAVETGRAVFQSRGCAGCHQDRLSLEKRRSPLTMADISAALWNHSLAGAEDRKQVSYDEMSALVSYVLSLGECGDRRRGRRVFAMKNCAGCHEGTDLDGRLPREGFPAAMVAALQNHSGNVQAKMHAQGLLWTRFTGPQMADLAADLEGGR